MLFALAAGSLSRMSLLKPSYVAFPRPPDMGAKRSEAAEPQITLPRKTVTAALFALMAQRDPTSLGFYATLEVASGLDDLIRELEAAVAADQRREN